MGDYDLNLRLLKANVPFEAAALRVSLCGAGGLSDSGRWLGYAEEIRVRHRHFAFWQCWIWDALSVARYFRKRWVRRMRRHG